MINKRTYTAMDIREMVEVLRHSPDISREKLSGMEMIADLCAELESMSDLDIEHAAQTVFRAKS